jgi:tetratricopeptide (TPR) repeat protein
VKLNRVFRSAAILLCAAFPALTAASAAARDFKAVVILKNPQAVGSNIPFVEVKKLKINDQDKIRVGNSSRHTGREYKKQPELKFEFIRSLEPTTLPGLMRLAYLDGRAQNCYCYPHKAPVANDNAWIQASAMNNVVVSGEFIVYGKKTKRSLSMTEIRKILFVAESEPLDESAFRWAAEEATASAWKEFRASFPGSTRIEAATDNLVSCLMQSAESRWQVFEQGGSLAMLKTVQALAEESLGLRRGHAGAGQMMERVRTAELAVHSSVEKMQAMVNGQDWDGALEQFRNIERFKPEIPLIADLETRALRGSFELHREKARQHVKEGKLEAGIGAYETALKRSADTEAAAELREARILLALREAEERTTKKLYPQAHDGLKAALRILGDDPRLSVLLNRVNNLWADQLFAEARPLFLPLRKIGAPATEAKYRKALESLEQAEKLVSRAEIDNAARGVRRHLAEYYFELGMKKLTLPRGQSLGQAFLHLQRAESYDNDLPGLLELRDFAAEAFRQKASVGINIKFMDRSMRSACSHVAGDIEGMLGAEITGARLPNVVVVEREEFEKLRQEQRITQESSTTPLVINVQGATMQILGDILVCSAKISQRASFIPSQYVSGYRDNPDWIRLAQLRDQYEAQAAELDQRQASYETCAKRERQIEHQTGQRTKVPGSCRYTQDQLRQQLSSVRGTLNQVLFSLNQTPAQLAIISPYRYTRRDLNLEGHLKVGFRIVDSLSSVRREQEQIHEDDTRSDFEISGAMPQDTGNVTDRASNLPSEDSLLESLLERVRRKVAAAAIASLRELPARYLERARLSRDRGATDEAVENYILFLAHSVGDDAKAREEAGQFLLEKRNLKFQGLN